LIGSCRGKKHGFTAVNYSFRNTYVVRTLASRNTHHRQPGTDSGAAISTVRLWGVPGRFFRLAAESIEADHPPLADKLHRASPHWMRHTHATHALGRGAELTTVRDNLRHASVSTTSIYYRQKVFMHSSHDKGFVGKPPALVLCT
jgi:integrase